MTKLRKGNEFLLLVLSLVLVVGCSKSEVAFSDLVHRDGRYFLRFSDTPYDGEVIGSVVAELEDGRINGELLRYDEDGNLVARENYLNGNLHGLRETYLDGKKNIHMSFKNGFLHGATVFPSQFGDWKFERHATFIDGFLHGPYVVRVDGRIWFETNFANHKVSADQVNLFEEDGVIALSIPFVNGQVEGEVEWSNGCTQPFSGGIAGEIKRPPPSPEQLEKEVETGSSFDYETMCFPTVLAPIPDELTNPESLWGDAPVSY